MENLGGRYMGLFRKLGVVGVIFSLCNLLLTGCLGFTKWDAQAVANLTPEQLEMIKELRQQQGIDFYMCLQGGGPPPVVTGLFLIFPKEQHSQVAFSSNCQILMTPQAAIPLNMIQTPQSFQLKPQ